MNRDAGWWKRSLGLEGNTPRDPVTPNWFLHEGPDGIDGLLGWSATGSHQLVSSDHKVEVQMLFTTRQAAYRDCRSRCVTLNTVVY